MKYCGCHKEPVVPEPGLGQPVSQPKPYRSSLRLSGQIYLPAFSQCLSAAIFSLIKRSYERSQPPDTRAEGALEQHRAGRTHEHTLLCCTSNGMPDGDAAMRDHERGAWQTLGQVQSRGASSRPDLLQAAVCCRLHVAQRPTVARLASSSTRTITFQERWSESGHSVIGHRLVSWHTLPTKLAGGGE